MKNNVRVLLVDCPWEYADRRAYRKDNPDQASRFGIGVKRRYSAGVMGILDLCDLKPLIQEVTTDDAYLFFWVVRPLMLEAYTVLHQWGFRFCTEFITWVKTTKNGSAFAGPGKYSLSNTEGLWLARKKKPNNAFLCKTWHNTGKGCYKPKQVLMAEHPRDENNKIIHSRKPPVVHEMIERMCFGSMKPEHRAMELFATTTYSDKWVTLGHAVTGNDIRVDLKNYILQDR